MRKILLLSVSLLLLGVGGAKAEEKISSDFSELSTDGASWDSENHTMGWSGNWGNALKYFMFKDLTATDGYYDLTLWETITVTFTLTGTTNGVRIRMKDNTGGDGDWILLDGAGEHTLNITDFKKGGMALNYSKIAGIQLSGGNNTSAASTATFSEISIYCADFTAKARTNLTNLITLAEKQHSLGKTDASFAALTSQIGTAETVRDNGSATLEQLIAAKAALQEKIDALQLLPGYYSLTLDMYKKWKVESGDIVEDGAGPGIIRLFEALNNGDVPYGHSGGSGDWNNFADLSDYSKLYVTGTAGERIRGYFNKTPEGTGVDDVTLTFNEQGIAEFDFVNGAFSDNDYIHLIFLKCPADNSGITSLLLYDGKHELKDAVTFAGKQNSFAKTDDSFAAIGTAVDASKTVLSNRTASDESISTAKTNLLNAINGVKLLDGYTKLTSDMFKTWDSATNPTRITNSSPGCAYVQFESTGMPYGDGNVYYLNYADLSEYSSMIILAPAGTPRVMFNRVVDNGSYSGTEADSKLIEIPKTGGWTDRYYTVDGTKYSYDLNLMTSGKGFAHLNAIKGANWTNVTVTDMLLYRTITVGSTGYATFGSLSKSATIDGVKTYAAKYSDGNLTLTEVTNVPAGKGVIIEAKTGSYAPTFDVDADDIDSDLEVSNGTVTGDGSTIFALANGTNGIGFYLVKNSNVIPAGKVYLKISGGGSVKEFIGFGDDVTGIKEIEKASSNTDNVIFNLSGQRMSRVKKGVNIVNGKKALVK